MKYDWNIDRVKEVVRDSINFTEVLQKLGIPRQGNNCKTLHKILDENGIDYSHFTGRARTYFNPKKSTVEKLATKNSPIKSARLKLLLIREGYKENKCECCGISEWMGKPLIIQLHHKDGDNTNNELDNIEMLCPNCHSQTDNYCGNANTNKKKNYCPDCGKEISLRSKYCTVCCRKHI